MAEHVLSISSEWARSHSGQNYIGRCSCAEWSSGWRGGYPADWPHIIREAHKRHVEDCGG